MGRATKQRGDQDGQRDGKRDDKNTSIRMTRTKAVVTLAVLFLLASAAGTPTFAAEDVEVKTNDALAALAQQMISTEGVLENVTIRIKGGVTDLTPLSGLKHIKNGNLTISGTSNLVSLAPLENLEVVDGDFRISDNAALTEISLPSLTEVGGDLGIKRNTALTGISLPSLTEVVGGQLGIAFNAALTAISMPSLTEVGGYLGIGSNAALTAISLPSLTDVGKELVIGNNDALTAISLPSLTEVGGWLYVFGNKRPTSLSLPNLDTVGNTFRVGSSWKGAQTFLANFSVASLGGDFDLTVDVFENEELAELAQQMISTEGVLENFTISITGGVTDLTPLSGLKHIKNGGLEVTNTTNLVSLAPLENLEVVDGNLAISL